MERKSTKLSRPHRKLNFLPDKERSPKRWGKKVTLEEVDRLFDNIDSSTDSFYSLMPLSPMPKTAFSSKEKEEVENKKVSSGQQTASLTENNECSPQGPKGKAQPTAAPVEKGNQNKTFGGLTEASSPFVEHNPINTSSPLEGEHGDQGLKAVSPIVFLFDEDDVHHEPTAASPSIARTQSQVQPLPDGSETQRSTAGPQRSTVPPEAQRSTAGPQRSTVPPEAQRSTAGPQRSTVPPEAQRSTVPPEAQRSTAGPQRSTVPPEPQRSTAGPQRSTVPPEAQRSTAGPQRSTVPPEAQRSTAGPQRSTVPPEPQRSTAGPQRSTVPPEPQRSTAGPQRSTAGPQQPAAALTPQALKEPSSLQKLREPGQSKATGKSLLSFKEPSLPEEPAQETEEDFVILEDSPPAWFSIPRKKDPGTVKHRGPNANAQPTTKDAAGQPSSPDRGLQTTPELSEPEALPSGGLLGRGEVREMKKRDRKQVSSAPRASPPRRTATNQAIGLKGTRTVAREEPSSASVPKRSKPTKVPRDQGEEKTRHKKARKPVKGRQRGKLLSSESEKELSPQQSPDTEAQHSDTASSEGAPVSRTRPLLSSSSEEAGSSDAPRRRGQPARKRPGTPRRAEEPVPKTPKRGRGRPRLADQSPATSTQDGGSGETDKGTVTSSPRLTAGRADKRKARKSPNKGRATGKVVKRGAAPGVREEELHLLQQEASPDGRRKTSRTRKAPLEWWILSNTQDSQPSPSSPSSPPASSPPPSPPSSPPASSPPPSSPPPSPPSPSPPPPPPQPRSQKRRMRGKRQSKQGASVAPAAPKDTLPPPPTPPRVAAANHAVSTPVRRGRMFSVPKSIKRSLATFQDIFSRTVAVSPPSAGQAQPEGHSTDQPSVCHTSADVPPGSGAPPSGEEAPAASSSPRPSWPSSTARTQPSKRLSGSMLIGFQSGPSSQIDLEANEENEDMSFPLTTAQCSYWMFLGLHSPPLVPMVLQEEDEANLKEWLSVLWPTPVQAEASQTSPGDFEWFCHRGRAIGLQMDMCSESLCNGKLILGSYMKKPLWVDHCAVTVFYMSTSCVVLTLNSKVSQYSSGQSFVVPCGQAYSIRNVEDQPAVMFFSWIQAESPE